MNPGLSFCMSFNSRSFRRPAKPKDGKEPPRKTVEELLKEDPALILKIKKCPKDPAFYSILSSERYTVRPQFESHGEGRVCIKPRKS